jgi:membrane protease subunit HflC
LKHNDTRFLLKPDTNFFRYFNDPAGKAGNGSEPQVQAPAASAR